MKSAYFKNNVLYIHMSGLRGYRCGWVCDVLCARITGEPRRPYVELRKNLKAILVRAKCSIESPPSFGNAEVTTFSSFVLPDVPFRKARSDSESSLSAREPSVLEANVIYDLRPHNSIMPYPCCQPMSRASSAYEGGTYGTRNLVS